MSLDYLLTRILILLGVGFLVANLLVVFQFMRFMRLRRSAILTWRGRRPPFYGLGRALAVVLAGLVIVKLGVQRRPPMDAFGESMMMLYYGVALPIGLRIGRGFYEDGIWSESGFMPYAKIGGLSWREGGAITLVLIHRHRQFARKLVVPRRHYGEARRVLLDKIAAHDIHFTGKSLDLGAHDEKDDV
jgi:hypothetical protein